MRHYKKKIIYCFVTLFFVFLGCTKNGLITPGINLIIYYTTDPNYFTLQKTNKYITNNRYGLSGLFVQRTGENSCVAYDLRSPNAYHSSIANPPCNTNLTITATLLQDGCIGASYSIETGLFFGENKNQAAAELISYRCFVDTINEAIYIP